MMNLDDFNANSAAVWHNLNNDEPVKNGIACPSCNAELMDSNPRVTLASYPPQKNTKCSECEYVGYRVC